MGRQVGGEIRCRGVGVITADGVQHVDPVGGEPIRGGPQRILALGDQTALDEILDVGQLHPRVADRGAAEPVQQPGPGPDLGGDRQMSPASRPW